MFFLKTCEITLKPLLRNIKDFIDLVDICNGESKSNDDRGKKYLRLYNQGCSNLYLKGLL